MIAAPAALALLAGLSGLAIGLGWLFGPALAATGIIGATIAPFLAGGDPGHPAILQAYFGLIALTGLLINAAQRWHLISGLALFVPFLGAAVASAMLDDNTSFIALSVGLCLAAGIFAGPERRAASRPALPGPSLLGALTGWVRPGRGQIGLTLFWGLATVSILSAAQASAPEAVAGIIGLTVLFVAAAAWAGRGAGAVDLAAMSAAALGVLSLMEAAPRYVAFGTVMGPDRQLMGADWIHPMP